jgi:hypothetical protein
VIAPVNKELATPYARVALLAVTVSGDGATGSMPTADDAEKFPCGVKLAASEWLPALRTPKLNVAEPVDSVIVNPLPPSTLSATVPVGVPPEEVTETVTVAGVP